MQQLLSHFIYLYQKWSLGWNCFTLRTPIVDFDLLQSECHQPLRLPLGASEPLQIVTKVNSALWTLSYFGSTSTAKIGLKHAFGYNIHVLTVTTHLQIR